jgi:hypothetical protein
MATWLVQYLHTAIAIPVVLTIPLSILSPQSSPPSRVHRSRQECNSPRNRSVKSLLHICQIRKNTQDRDTTHKQDEEYDAQTDVWPAIPASGAAIADAFRYRGGLTTSHRAGKVRVFGTEDWHFWRTLCSVGKGKEDG